ncbi:tape-measure protein [Streptomyces antarcticus]|uniref:tape-measure protein n=1 Tax=Streptomyces antarcticus TaxID=2996458 RepID=UPI00226F5011|nr:tape-measure protein [Streptomyces sp. H34-AA3]MCY0941558.1 tape-measure protein [Streptomyces sp. H34-AA3]
MSAAVVANPFGRLTRSMNGVRTHAVAATRNARQVTSSLKQIGSTAKKAATDATGLASAASPAGKILSTLKTQATAAATSAAKVARSATRASTGTKRVDSGARGAVTSLRKMGRKTSGVLAVIAGLLPAIGIVSTLMSTFGIAMTVGAVVMTAINVAMRANPLGFVLGILIPLGAWLIELAMNSETGQKFIEQTFTVVLQVFEGYLKFLIPVLTAVATIVTTYFKGYSAVISSVVGGLRGAVSGFSGTGSSARSATSVLRGIASGAFNAIMAPIRPVISFLTGTLPGAFARIRTALSSALGGIGRMVSTGAQAVLAAVTGPFNGIIAFANWIIDGLEDLSFELLGKKFGVDLDKIPMLAEGGVVWPTSQGRAPVIHPVSDLDRRRVAPASAQSPRQGPHRIAEYREPAGAGPRSTAEDLLFLAAAHA